MMTALKPAGGLAATATAKSQMQLALRMHSPACAVASDRGRLHNMAVFSGVRPRHRQAELERYLHFALSSPALSASGTLALFLSDQVRSRRRRRAAAYAGDNTLHMSVASARRHYAWEWCHYCYTWRYLCCAWCHYCWMP